MKIRGQLLIKKDYLTPESVATALSQGDFVPYFQPIVTMASGQLTGLEMLVRWNHKTHGLIGPDEFIPHAEKHGWIDQLTQQVLHNALLSARWIPEPLTLSVNVSLIQLRGSTLPGLIIAALAQTGFSPERLIIEITESTLIENLDRTLQTINELKTIGCELSLDDFGTGYSSLSHLHSLPFDELKVDRSFINSMVDQQSSRKIVSAIVGLGQSLGLRTVAEGIETQEQADIVAGLGCDLGQGWLYGRPVAANDLASLIKANRRAFGLSDSGEHKAYNIESDEATVAYKM
jgi:EAL domain-containing protein (putative c-di-GMP-specific phosphodiesterase class I)